MHLDNDDTKSNIDQEAQFSTINIPNEPKKKSKAVLCMVIVAAAIVCAICGTILIPVIAENIGKNHVIKAFTPKIEKALEKAKKATGLSDLSYKVGIDDYDKSDNGRGEYISVQGDIILLSDEIEKLPPDEMYHTMQNVSEDFFQAIKGESFECKVDNITFRILHGNRYSRWRTSKGTEYEANYFELKKNNMEIYKNPYRDRDKERYEFTHPAGGGSGNTGNSGGKSNSSGGHSSSNDQSSSTSDPYNAKEYSDIDDFWEEYYNDFADFDEAEQYWNGYH